MGQPVRTVAVVGPDGSGKTTQAKLLVERLRAAGYDAQYVHALYYLSDRFPYAERLRGRFGPRQTRTGSRGPTRLGSAVRRTLFGLFGLLFAVLTLGVVALQYRGADQVVVFDRYYQQFLYDVYGPIGRPLTRLLPQPSRTIYLEADVETVRARADSADSAVETLYYTTVIELLDDCVASTWRTIPAERPVEAIHGEILAVIGCTEEAVLAVEPEAAGQP